MTDLTPKPDPVPPKTTPTPVAPMAPMAPIPVNPPTPPFSWVKVVTPFVAGVAGFAAAHGFALSPDETSAVTVLAAGGASAIWHWIETRS